MTPYQKLTLSRVIKAAVIAHCVSYRTVFSLPPEKIPLPNLLVSVPGKFCVSTKVDPTFVPIMGIKTCSFVTMVRAPDEIGIGNVPCICAALVAYPRFVRGSRRLC